MSLESPNTSNSLEVLRQGYRQKLDTILYKELTVENIDTFADDALNDLISLNEEILEQSKIDSSSQSNVFLTKREQEDFVYQKLGLPDIQEILERINSVRDRIENIKRYLLDHKQYTDAVITPPEKNGHAIEKGSEKGLKERSLVPRLLTLMYLLEVDFDIRKETVSVLEGEVHPGMIRKTPYIRVEIPELDRVVYLCEEEQNASYIFDTKKLQELGVSIDRLDIDNKGEKNVLIVEHPGIGVRLAQSSQWRRKMSMFLSETISEEAMTSAAVHTSEFLEKKDWPPFEEFQKEVQSLYPGGNTFRWYMQERKQHSHWPSNPNDTYKNKGWEGWSRLVGKENPYKKIEGLPFSEFQAEVRSLFPEGPGAVHLWYAKERKNHKNWPTQPYVDYKEQGWVGWAELVGRESHLKKEFLPFDEFKEEVKALYTGSHTIVEWYKQERKNHPNWPSMPDRKYKDKGWTNWLDLVKS
jgi:hypothetical protein